MDQIINLPPHSTPAPVREVAPKGHVFIKIVLMILIIGGLGAGGAWAYFHYYAQKPETLIYNAFVNFGKVKTYSFDSNSSVKGKGPRVEKSLTKSISQLSGAPENFEAGDESAGAQEGEVKVSTKGIIDVTDAKQKKQQMNINFSFQMGEQEETPSLGIDFLNDSKVVAIRVPKIPVLLGMDLSYMNNQWVSYDYSKVREKLDALIEQQKLKAQENFSDEDEKKLMETVKKTVMEKPLITVTKKFKKEILGGVETQPYAFTLNKENLVYLLETVAQDERAGVTAEEIAEFKTVIADIKKLDGTIWLGGEEVLPYKISLAGTFQDAQTKDDLKIILNFSFSNFNKPVKIEAPQDAITFEEAFNRVMQKQMEASMLKTDEVDVFGNPLSMPSSEGSSRPDGDLDGDGLSDATESLYGTDVMKKDSDGDGYEDKVEIESGHDPLKR